MQVGIVGIVRAGSSKKKKHLNGSKGRTADDLGDAGDFLVLGRSSRLGAAPTMSALWQTPDDEDSVLRMSAFFDGELTLSANNRR